MGEYIESEFNPCDVCNYKRCNNCVLHELAMKIVGYPAADVAPVVRCKECDNHSESNGYHYCKFWRMYCPDDSDFFCKAGKRKAGDDNG